MNNWNLQQAVCSYFDLDAPKDVLAACQMPTMTLVRDVTIGEGEEVPPNTKFIKTWRVLNSGMFSTRLRAKKHKLTIGNCNRTRKVAFRVLVAICERTSNVCLWESSCWSARARATDRHIHRNVFTRSCRNLSRTMADGDRNWSVLWRDHLVDHNSSWRWIQITFVLSVFITEYSKKIGGLLSLTQQMDSFHQLGSPPAQRTGFLTGVSGPTTINPFNPRVQQGVASGSPVSGSLLLSSLTSPLPAVHHRDQMFASHQQHMTGSASPPITGSNPIDRLKATPTDDNRENCFKVVSSVLARSPSTSISMSNAGVHAVGPDQQMGDNHSPATASSSSLNSSHNNHSFANNHNNSFNNHHNHHNHLGGNGAVLAAPLPASVVGNEFPPTPPPSEEMNF